MSKKNNKNEKDTEKEITEKEEKKDLMVKENSLSEVQLEKIAEEIKKQTTISEEKKKKIHKKLFYNILFAIIIVLYFIFINLGFYNLKEETFFKDLQVFSMISIGITIIVFEKAYKKDSDELALQGIELLVLSICTLMTIYIKMNYENKFSYIINIIALLFAIYYVGKCIAIYYKMSKIALKQSSDIHKIIKNKD